MKLLLTSCLNLYHKDSEGKKIAHVLDNTNGILDLIKKLTPKQENFVLVASSPNNYDATDTYARLTFKAFDLTYPFQNYTILDGRTKDKTEEIIQNADLIFLCGGHVPTQNAFFQDINLEKYICNTNALIIGQSAGSMNCAEIVYAQPELEGESIDPNYKKYLKGLGLTNISILPHFEQCKNNTIDGKNIFKEISLPNSKIKPFIAYSDGAFIYDNGKNQFMYGKAYLFKNMGFQKISEDDTITDITELVDDEFRHNYYDLIK